MASFAQIAGFHYPESLAGYNVFSTTAVRFDAIYGALTPTNGVTSHLSVLCASRTTYANVQ